MSFSDTVQGENGLLIELRCKNSFNEHLFADILNYLNEHLPEWKANGSIPIADAVPILIYLLCCRKKQSTIKDYIIPAT